MADKILGWPQDSPAPLMYMPHIIPETVMMDFTPVIRLCLRG